MHVFMSAVLPIFCFTCFLTQLHCAFCFHWHQYSRSRPLFLEMMLSVLSIWNFFHFNVTASNFASLQSIEIYSNTLSITEPVYCDRLLVGPYHSYCYFRSFLITPLPYGCDDRIPIHLLLPLSDANGLSLAALQYICIFFTSIPPTQVFLGYTFRPFVILTFTAPWEALRGSSSHE